MTDAVRVRPARAFDETITPPGSKSLTNRALLLAALADGRTTLEGWLDADDTSHMRSCLHALGVAVTAQDSALVVEGAGGPFRAVREPPALFVGTAGTVARFLLAALAASPASADMDGSARMRERPMAQLIDALRELGADIRCSGHEGALPLRVGSLPRPLEGGAVRLERPASSQFVSALLIAGVLATNGLRIELAGGTPARPYVDMTVATITAFGGRAAWESEDTLVVEPAKLRGRAYRVEPDASAATYLLAAAALHRSRMTVPGLGSSSLQGDVGFAEVLARFGARVDVQPDAIVVEGTGTLQGQRLDLSAMPDTTLTAAVVALYANGPTEIRGVEILRHHESDRIAAGAAELRKLGATVQEHEDGLTIHPPLAGPTSGVQIETYDDHRMAMAFSLAGEVTVLDPGCVAKTYPEYFRDLETLGMVVS